MWRNLPAVYKNMGIFGRRDRAGHRLGFRDTCKLGLWPCCKDRGANSRGSASRRAAQDRQEPGARPAPGPTWRVRSCSSLLSLGLVSQSVSFPERLA